jgi:hypothetical protein
MALFGWGRPLYDEELARRFLQSAGVPDPADESVRHLAQRLRRRTLQIRIISVITAILVVLAVLKAVIG